MNCRWKALKVNNFILTYIFNRCQNSLNYIYYISKLVMKYRLSHRYRSSVMTILQLMYFACQNICNDTSTYLYRCQNSVVTNFQLAVRTEMWLCGISSRLNNRSMKWKFCNSFHINKIIVLLCTCICSFCIMDILLID